MRDLGQLPKAHLHLHLTGGMRHGTLVELAEEQGVHLPHGLLEPGSVDLDATGLRGWLKFQRLYDQARNVLRGPTEVRRVVREIVEDQALAGVQWLELQVDPSTYAPRLGGLQGVVEVVLDALGSAGDELGVGTGLVIAANRTRHHGDAETHARVARRFAGRGVVGFGLSNDETRGDTRDFEKAFHIARDAGLIAVPHAGELRGPGSVRLAVERLGAARVGHGVRSVEDPALLALLAERSIACEVNPVSNVMLGVHAAVTDCPWRVLREHGVPVVVGADDPLVFRAGLLENYALLGAADEELADLARCSVGASTAPPRRKAAMLAGIEGWLLAD